MSTEEQTAPTHSITLNVQVSSPEDWRAVFLRLANLSASLPSSCDVLTVSSYPIDDGFEEEGEHYDEYTLMKVFKAIRACGVDANRVGDIIQELQNAGILFRERREVVES